MPFVVQAVAGSLPFSGAFALFGLRPPGMLAAEAGLKVFDLLLDFLFGFAGLKEDVVRVSALPFEFVAVAFPVVLVVLFIALQQAGEFVIGFTARQFHVHFMLPEVVIAEEAQLGQPLQRGQGEVEAPVDEVKRMVEHQISACIRVEVWPFL